MSEENFNPSSSPLHKQVGGKHYKDCSIQPVEYIHANKLDYFEGNVIKYITRHRTKGEGKKDVEKAIHYAQLILELYYPDEKKQEELFDDLIERGRHV
tara:strand:+ start:388 stop:681 length:294 start_codon:yes stop_codon:yes gene_type:complete